jgi:signal transduction histidine kinase/ActR/RegA family two-component response regulator/HAMP domain-containing protein
MYARFRLYGIIALLVIAASVLLAYFLSRFLQRRIARPIIELAEAAQAVSIRQDYSVRATKLDDDELGALTDAFNQMLTQIQEHTQERTAAATRLQAQVGRLHLLNRITHAIGDRQDLSSIYGVLLRSLEDNLPIDFGCICLYNPFSEILVVTSVGSKGIRVAEELGLVVETRVPIDQNGLARCVDGNLVYEPDTRDVQFPFPQRLASGGLHAFVAAPLLVEEKVFGVLVAARRNAESFSSADCEFLRQLSEHVALAAHQAKLYGELQQAYDDLRQTQRTVMQQDRLRALGEMASGIAHDINNAISPAALYTQSLLEREPNLSERARGQLGTIQRAIEDVAHTVSRMREFYRQREPQLMLTPLDLNQLIQHVIDSTRARWRDVPQQQGVVIDLHTDLEPRLPTVMGAESEIRDALTNLIFNAVDAMPDGGTLRLRTCIRAASEDAAHQSVHVEVCDTGAGMDDETKRRSLEPFFTTKGERGTGLGLAMVYGMVQRHSADIEVDSTVGVGTTIRLIFPVATALPHVSRSAPVSTSGARQLRVLVVDDDPALIRALRDILAIDGHDITTAEGGQAGIDTFGAALSRGESFSAVITDLGMPYVDGRKVAAAIKEQSPETPIILLTGWGQRLAADRDIPPYVDRLLSKPPKLEDLRTALLELTSAPVA